MCFKVSLRWETNFIFLRDIAHVFFIGLRAVSMTTGTRTSTRRATLQVILAVVVVHDRTEDGGGVGHATARSGAISCDFQEDLNEGVLENAGNHAGRAFGRSVGVLALSAGRNDFSHSAGHVLSLEVFANGETLAEKLQKAETEFVEGGDFSLSADCREELHADFGDTLRADVLHEQVEDLRLLSDVQVDGAIWGENVVDRFEEVTSGGVVESLSLVEESEELVEEILAGESLFFGRFWLGFL